MPAAAHDHTGEQALLEELLRKERVDPQKTAVNWILSHPLTIRQQVEAIRRVDREKDAVGVLRAVRTTAAQAARNHAARMSLLVKRQIPKASALHFLFHDAVRVMRFGRTAGVLKAKLLPPWIRPHPRLARLFSTEFRTLAVEVSQRLAPVLESGWMCLTPQQYNLLVLLKRLAEALRAVDVPQIGLGRSYAIDRLARLESLFLMLHYDPESLKVVLQSVRASLLRQHGAGRDGEHLTGLILKLLAEDCSYPSLYNCILGLNMLKLRRFVVMRDILREGLGQMVETRQFDFESSVRERVDDALDDALQSVRMLHEQLREARTTNGYLSADTQGQADLRTLRELYESAAGRPASSFVSDQEHVLVFATRLARRFHEVFSPLLNGLCQIERVGRVTIFSPSFFSSELARLLEAAERLDQEQFRYSHFPLTRYLRIMGGQLRAIGEEREISNLIAQDVQVLVDIGKTISKIVGLRSPASEAGDRRHPLEPANIQGPVFSIPYESARIRARSPLNGATVLDALRTAVSMCFAVGVLFRDEFLLMYFNRTRKLEIELDLRVKQLERLADDSFKEIMSLGSPPGGDKRAAVECGS